MGLLGDIFNGFISATASQLERNARTAHKAAESGIYKGRRLSESGREKMRMAEDRYRDAADRAQDIYNARKQQQRER